MNFMFNGASMEGFDPSMPEPPADNAGSPQQQLHDIRMMLARPVDEIDASERRGAHDDIVPLQKR